MCCSVYSSTLATSLVPRLLFGGGGKRTWYTRSRMCKVPLVTCLLLKLMEIFCLPAERLTLQSNTACETPPGGFEVRNNNQFDSNVCIPLFKTIGELQKEDCVSQSVTCHSI